MFRFLSAPLAFPALIVSTLAFVAPFRGLRIGITSLSPHKPDGPSIWMGPLGSCARSNNSSPLHCTSLRLLPKYDLSVISGDGEIFQNIFVSRRAAETICASLVLSILFFVLASLGMVPRFGKSTGMSLVTLLFGIASIVIAPIPYLYIFVVFDFANRVFNKAGNNQVKATIGMSFILLVVASWISLVLAVCFQYMAYQFYKRPGKKDEQEDGKKDTKDTKSVSSTDTHETHDNTKMPSPWMHWNS